MMPNKITSILLSKLLGVLEFQGNKIIQKRDGCEPSLSRRPQILRNYKYYVWYLQRQLVVAKTSPMTNKGESIQHISLHNFQIKRFGKRYI